MISLSYQIAVILLLLASVAIGFIFPKSRVVRVIQFLILFSLFYWTKLIDYHNYEHAYVAKEISFESFYVFLMSIGWTCGLQFDLFRLIYVAVYLVFLDLYILKYSKRPNIVLSLYIIFSALFDSELMRFFMAMIPILFGIHILYEYKRKTDILIYYGLVVISVFLHSSMSYFLFVPLLWAIGKKRFGRIAIIIVSIGLFVLMSTSAGSSIYSLYALISGRVYSYSVSSDNVLKSMVFMLAYFTLFASSFFVLAKLDKTTSLKVLRLCITSVPLIIFLRFAGNSSRLMHVYLLVLYVIFSNVDFKINKQQLLKYAFPVVPVFMLVFQFVFLSKTSFNDVWLLTLETNQLFNFLFGFLR